MWNLQLNKIILFIHKEWMHESMQKTTFSHHDYERMSECKDVHDCNCNPPTHNHEINSYWMRMCGLIKWNQFCMLVLNAKYYDKIINHENAMITKTNHQHMKTPRFNTVSSVHPAWHHPLVCVLYTFVGFNWTIIRIKVK